MSLHVGVVVLLMAVQTAEPVGSKPEQDDGAALAGPKVSAPKDRTLTLIEREFDGRFKPLEQHPVLVALDRMSLDAEVRAKVDEVLQSRASQLDTLVRDNLKLIVELGLANQANDKADAQKHLAELLQKAQPFLKRGPLLDEVLPALPEAQSKSLKHAVDEYFAEARTAAEPGREKKRDRLGALLFRGLDGVRFELKSSYERVVQAGGNEFDQLLKELALSPEQESRVRQKAIDLFQKTYGKPTKMQQARLILEIYSELTPEQRRVLAGRIGQERRDEYSARLKKARQSEAGGAPEPRTAPADPMDADTAAPTPK